MRRFLPGPDGILSPFPDRWAVVFECADSSFCCSSFLVRVVGDRLFVAAGIAEHRQRRHDGGSNMGLRAAVDIFGLLPRVGVRPHACRPDAARNVFVLDLVAGFWHWRVRDALAESPLGCDCPRSAGTDRSPAFHSLAARAFRHPTLRILLHGLRAVSIHANSWRDPHLDRGTRVYGPAGHPGCCRGSPAVSGSNSSQRGQRIRDGAGGGGGHWIIRPWDLAADPSSEMGKGHCIYNRHLHGRVGDLLYPDLPAGVWRKLPVECIAGQHCLCSL